MRYRQFYDKLNHFHSTVNNKTIYFFYISSQKKLFFHKSTGFLKSTLEKLFLLHLNDIYLFILVFCY